jgi:hypothetical protein
MGQKACSLLVALLVSFAAFSVSGVMADTTTVRVERLVDAPIITPATDPSIGTNIQGPSLIAVPDWVERPLGRYYLYFADHKGAYIRLAYADELTGPWYVHTPGSLRLEDSYFPVMPPEVPEEGRERVEAAYAAAGIDLESLPHDPLLDMTTPHIASPDVHVDHHNQRIVMYFHGLETFGLQLSRVATSRDGIEFSAREELIGRTYMRAFQYDGYTYLLAMPGQFYRSRDPLSGFTEGPMLFEKDMRHSAVLVRDDTLLVFWTRVGDVPERIQLSRVDLTKPWMQWQAGNPQEVLRPEREWEGATAPLVPSVRSVAYGEVNQLRDPAIFVEEGRTYLLYAVAGESGISIAQLYFD